jgi:hypothetical protein
LAQAHIIRFLSLFRKQCLVLLHPIKYDCPLNFLSTDFFSIVMIALLIDIPNYLARKYLTRREKFAPKTTLLREDIDKILITAQIDSIYEGFPSHYCQETCFIEAKSRAPC